MNTSSGFPLFSGPWSLITSVNGGPWTPCHLGVLSPLLQGTGREGHLLGMILFALTRLFGTFISCTDSLSFPEGLPRDQETLFLIPCSSQRPQAPPHILLHGPQGCCSPDLFQLSSTYRGKRAEGAQALTVFPCGESEGTAGRGGDENCSITDAGAKDAKGGRCN